MPTSGATALLRAVCVSLTLHGVLGSKSRDTTKCADHEILEHLVARLAALVAIALKGRDVGGVRLATRAAGEGGFELGVRCRGIGRGIPLGVLLDGGGRGAQGGQRLATGATHQRRRRARGDGHGDGEGYAGAAVSESNGGSSSS